MRWNGIASWAAIAVGAPIAGGILSYVLVTTQVFGALSPTPATIPPFSPTAVQQVLAEQFPVYWVGPEFQGLTLEGTLTNKYPPQPGVPEPPTNSVTLIYGECTPVAEPGDDHPSCPVPLSIVVEPYCSRRPEFMPDSLKEEPFVIRGAQAFFLADPTVDDLVVYTGKVRITIHGPDRETDLAVANELRSMNQLGVQSAAQPLGPVTATCPP